MNGTAKVTCRNCERRVEFTAAHTASRFGGGNYRRAGRYYPSTICTECVLDLAPRLRVGASTVDRWGGFTLQRIARVLYTPEFGPLTW